ncbi:MAG: hypothetical protein LBB43_03535 [Spirochaetaceae bacterium]|nr:hypothetical protein [Spirochaetaceae bacterium]
MYKLVSPPVYSLFIILFIVSAETYAAPPQWWFNPPQDPLYYYGVGSASIEGEEWNAWEAARVQGLEFIAHQVETRIYAMQADYNKQAGNGASDFFISMTIHIVQIILRDTKPVQRVRIDNTCYVLLSAPKDKARVIITESIDNEVKKNPLFQKETAIRVMENMPAPTPAPVPTQTQTPIPTWTPTLSDADYARRNSLGGNFSLEWSDDKVGVGLELIELHWSFLPFTSIGISIYPYFLGGYHTLELMEYATIALGASLYAGLVYPLTTNYSGFNARLYADVLFNMQIANGFGLGFDTGLALTVYGWGIDIRYRGMVYDEHYVNSIGIGLVFMFND